MTKEQPKIQKALIPAGAGIVAVGAAIKILALAVVGAILIIVGVRRWRGRSVEIGNSGETP